MPVRDCEGHYKAMDGRGGVYYGKSDGKRSSIQSHCEGNYAETDE